MRRNASSSPTFDKAFERAARLCAGSEHCAWDIRHKLYEWGVAKVDADTIIERLYDDNYINDERFARAYCIDRLRFSHWGRIKITAMLQRMGIPDIAIQYGLEQIDQQEYREVMEHVIVQKDKTMDENDTYKRHMKLMRFATSRGFELSEIHNFLPED